MYERRNDRLPWPFRGIANFFLYRRYLNEISGDEAYRLAKDISQIGFNRAVELFHDNYTANSDINNSITRSDLRREVERAERERKDIEGKSRFR